MDDLLLDSIITSSSGSSEIEGNIATSSCAASTLEALNNTKVLPTALNTALRVFQIIYVVILLVLGTLLNSLLVLLICKFRELRTPSFGIAFQICLNDVCLSIAFGISYLVTQIAGHWILGINFCIFIGFVLFSFFFLRTFLVFVFAVDKFCLVFTPFFYPKHSHKIVVIMCALSWCVSFVYSIIFIPGLLDCYDFVEPAMTCIFSSKCNKNCEVVNYILLPVTILPGTIIALLLFLGLYIKGRKLRFKHQNVFPQNGSRMTREDWRALKTFALLFLAILVIIFPPFIVFIVFQSLDINVAGYLAIIISVNISFLHVITDPLIMMRNGDVKECFKKVYKEIYYKLFRRNHIIRN